MVGGELPGPAGHVTGLALEAVLPPVVLAGVGRSGALDDVLGAGLRHRAEGAVGVGELQPVEGPVHHLVLRREVARRRPAGHDIADEDHGGEDGPPHRERGVRRPGVRDPRRGKRQDDRRPVQPREVAREHQPQLGEDHDRRRARADEQRPGGVRHQGQHRDEQQPRHPELRDVVADDLTAVEPAGQQVRGPAERPGHRLGLVVVHQGGEVAPFPPAADLDHPGTELQPEQQPPEQDDDDRRRRLGGGAEEGGEEPGLAQQHLPAEPVERLADTRHRHVPGPQSQETQHRHPGWPGLRQAGDQQGGEDDAGGAQDDQAPVGVAAPPEDGGAQDLPPGRRLDPSCPAEEPGGGEQTVLARQRSELVERGDESDEEQHRDAPLQHLARDLEIHGGETVHGSQGRRIMRA